MEPGRQGAEQSPTTTSYTSPGGYSIEEPAMAPHGHSTGDAGSLPSPTSSQRLSDLTIRPNECLPTVAVHLYLTLLKQ